MKNRILEAFPDKTFDKEDLLKSLCVGKQPYFILMTPRSGSTWLTEQAAASGLLGFPQEWFNDFYLNGDGEQLGCPTRARLGSRALVDYVRSITDRFSSPEGLVGFQLSRWDAEELFRLLPDLLDESRAKFFYLRRRNVVAQGISLYRSIRSGAFHTFLMTEEDKRRYSEVPYDDAEITHWIRHVVQDYEAWFSRLLAEHGLARSEIFYEDLERDMAGVLEGMYRSLTGGSMEGRGGPSAEGKVRRLRDHLNEAWEDRWRSSHPGIFEEFVGRAGETVTR